MSVADMWETDSLAWIHAFREKEQASRGGTPPRPLSREDAEKLAARYGVKLANGPRSR